MSARVTIVIVSWNVRQEVLACLASVPDRLPCGYGVRTVLVDNASRDGTVDAVRAQFPSVHIIANTQNLGFARACNQGARAVAGEYLFFLNPDTLVSGDALQTLVDFLERQPFVAIVGPRLDNQNGQPQPSVRRFPSVWTSMLVLLKLHRVLPRHRPLRRYFMSHFTHTSLRAVDQVMGACLAVRRRVFMELGGFDERFFIWFEEVDFCRRVRTAGHLIFFVPQARIIHMQGRSFTQRGYLWRQWHYARSCRQYFWKHHSWGAALIIAGISYCSLVPAFLLALVMRPRRG